MSGEMERLAREAMSEPGVRRVAVLLALGDGLRWGTDISSREDTEPYLAKAAAMIAAARIVKHDIL